MGRLDRIEMMARQVVSVILRNPRWDAHLDEMCDSLHQDAERATPRQTMMAVAARSEQMLRHIAQGDPVVIGRLYFDLLPPLPHPLTAQVIEALSQPAQALRLLHDSGLHPALLKDDLGRDVLEIELPDSSAPLCDTLRDAITDAMSGGYDAPPQGLHTIH